MSMGRVFLVDDEEHVRKTVGLALKQGGYEVLEAADGEEAIAAIQSYPAGFSVHAIICDIELPKVNGHDLIAFIRAKLPSVPIIVLTGHPDVQALLLCSSKVWWTISSSRPRHKRCWMQSGGLSENRRRSVGYL